MLHALERIQLALRRPVERRVGEFLECHNPTRLPVASLDHNTVAALADGLQLFKPALQRRGRTRSTLGRRRGPAFPLASGRE